MPVCDKQLEQLNLTLLENGNESMCVCVCVWGGGGGGGAGHKVHVVVYVLARCVFVCGGRR